MFGFILKTVLEIIVLARTMEHEQGMAGKRAEKGGVLET